MQRNDGGALKLLWPQRIRGFVGWFQVVQNLKRLPSGQKKSLRTNKLKPVQFFLLQSVEHKNQREKLGDLPCRMDHHHFRSTWQSAHASCGNFFDFLLTQLSIHGFSGLKIAMSGEKKQSTVGVILSHGIKS